MLGGTVSPWAVPRLSSSEGSLLVQDHLSSTQVQGPCQVLALSRTGSSQHNRKGPSQSHHLFIKHAPNTSTPNFGCSPTGFGSAQKQSTRVPLCLTCTRLLGIMERLRGPPQTSTHHTYTHIPHTHHTHTPPHTNPTYIHTECAWKRDFSWDGVGHLPEDTKELGRCLGQGHSKARPSP